MKNSEKSASSTHSKKTRRWLLAGLPLLAILTWFVPNAMAHRGHRGPKGGFWGGHGGHHGPEGRKAFMREKMQRLLELVDASDAQKEAIEAVVARSEKAMEGHHEKRRDMMKALKEVLSADVLDEAKLAELQTQHQQMLLKGSEVRSSVLMDVARILEPEQRRKAIEHFEKFFRR